MSETGLIIAIDGCSSSGKGTFAKRIASALGILYLDSGAIYRAVTLHSLEEGIISWNGEIDTKRLQDDILFGRIDISVSPAANGNMAIALDGKDVSKQIRRMDVADNVSAVSALPFVRNFVDVQLRRLGSEGCVIDGRDIGTAVFPDADLKLFMTADPEVRARRRYDEMLSAGEPADFDAVLRNVNERDYMDSHRKYHPLCRANDAILLDNSNMTVDQQMEWLSGILKEKFGIVLQ